MTTTYEHITKWAPRHLSQLGRVVNHLRRAQVFRPISGKDWLLSGAGRSHGSEAPPYADVCLALHRKRKLALKQYGPVTSNNWLWIALKLGCHGGMQLSTAERFILVRAIEVYWDPGVPVDLEFWLAPDNQDDTLLALEYFVTEYAEAEGMNRRQREDAEALYRRMKVYAPGTGTQRSKPASQKTEKERQMDFFFGKRKD